MFSSVINRLNDRRAAGLDGEEADAGFTLIELMVVLLILAILLAIAIPTFLGVTGSANDRAAQSNLNTAITSGKGIYESNQQAYPTTTNQLGISIKATAPSLPILTATTGAAALTQATAGNMVSTVDGSGNAALYMTLAKKTNECWFMADTTQLLTTASGPWVSSTKGLPLSAGEVYGVYQINATNTSCDTGTLATLTVGSGAGQVTESATQFPNAATQ